MLMDSLLVRASCEEVGKFYRSVHLITRYSVPCMPSPRWSLEVDHFFEFEIPLMFMLFFSPWTTGLRLVRFSLSSAAETEAVLAKWHLHQVGRVHEWRYGYRSWSLRSRGCLTFEVIGTSAANLTLDLDIFTAILFYSLIYIYLISSDCVERMLFAPPPFHISYII